MDEELEDIDSSKMSLKVVCPVCGQWLRLPEMEPVEGPRVPPEILKAMMSQSQLIERGAGASDPKKQRDADEATDSPSPAPQSSKRPWWRFWG
jgi:hypothetical protein